MHEADIFSLHLRSIPCRYVTTIIFISLIISFDLFRGALNLIFLKFVLLNLCIQETFEFGMFCVEVCGIATQNYDFF